MADNVAITAGSGTSIAADAITDAGSPGVAGVDRYHQRVKIETGPEGVAKDVSRLDALPIEGLAIERLLQAILVELTVLTKLMADQAIPPADLGDLRGNLQKQELS